MLPIVIDRWVVDIGISVGRQGKEGGDRPGGRTAADVLQLTHSASFVTCHMMLLDR